MNKISGLKPELFWNHFLALTQIPRPSGQEEKVRRHVVDWGKKAGLETAVDASGNVVIRVAATPGLEKAPITVLQAHLDMVAEKNADSSVDPNRDPLEVYRDGDFLQARGTTLGADNGIGVAAAMAMAEDKSFKHGPLELVFTYDEERGLTGAKNLDPKLIRGRRLLNLDSDIHGVFYVGCAGGEDTVTTLDLKLEAPPAGRIPCTLRVEGLKGGHSGVDIHHNRANAIKILALALRELAEKHPFSLAVFSGGSKRNAIPREAAATILLEPPAFEAAQSLIRAVAERFTRDYAGIENEVRLTLAKAAAAPAKVLVAPDGARLLALVAATPSGVMAMSRDVAGMVETSTNLGVVTSEGGRVEICNLKRSSVAESLVALRGSLHALAALAGAKTREEAAYPGWKPDMKSPLLQRSLECFKKLSGREGEVTAIHAGLECGIIGEKFPGMDMISFGTELHNAHSPDEKVSIPATEKFYAFLGQLLESLARG